MTVESSDLPTRGEAAEGAKRMKVNDVIRADSLQNETTVKAYRALHALGATLVQRANYEMAAQVRDLREKIGELDAQTKAQPEEAVAGKWVCHVICEDKPTTTTSGPTAESVAPVKPAAKGSKKK